MYVCYADESGHCGAKYNPRQPVEVLCGVLSDFSKLFKTQREHSSILDSLNKKFGVPLPELKASEAYRGRNAWSKVPPAERDSLYEAILGWASDRSCKYLVSPIDSKQFFDRKAAGCAFSNQLGFPYEAGAVNLLMGIQRSQSAKKNNKGKTLVIFDEQVDHDKNLIKILEGDLAFTDPFTGYVKRPRAKNQPERLDQIIDVPHFSKSHLSVLIQIADWAAFVVNSYISIAAFGTPEKYPGELKKLEGWYKAIGDNLLAHTSMDAPGKDGIVQYYKSIRPQGWSASKWTI